MLTLKQKNFCVAYMQTGNASEAYRRIYNVGRMKQASIGRKAKELMDNGKITAYIDELRAPVLEKLEASEEKTIRRLMQGQEFDIRRLYHPDGRIKKPHELDDDTAGAIVGVRYDKDGNLLEYKAIDVKGCAELLGRHLKLFSDKLEVGGAVEVVFTRRIIPGK
jgi:hypothetical protein